MPLYHTIAYTDTGTKASQNLDPSIVPFNANIAVTVGTSGTYKLQYSLSANDVSDANALWFDSVDIPSGTTASATSVLTSPVSRIRLVIAANGGTITLQVRQGLSTN